MGHSIREYIIPRDTAIWTSLSHTRLVGGKLTRLHSFRSSSPDLDPHLHLLLRLQQVHMQLNLRLQLKRHLQLKLRLLRLAVKQKPRGLYPAAGVKAVNGRANRDKSATTSPWFRGGQAILSLREMLAR